MKLPSTVQLNEALARSDRSGLVSEVDRILECIERHVRRHTEVMVQLTPPYAQDTHPDAHPAFMRVVRSKVRDWFLDRHIYLSREYARAINEADILGKQWLFDQRPQLAHHYDVTPCRLLPRDKELDDAAPVTAAVTNTRPRINPAYASEVDA